MVAQNFLLGDQDLPVREKIAIIQNWLEKKALI